MPKKKYSEDEIYTILKEWEAGLKMPELIRKYGVVEQTLYRWRAKYGGMEKSDMKKLKDLEMENAKLKRLVADLSLDKAALQDLIEKKL